MIQCRLDRAAVDLSQISQRSKIDTQKRDLPADYISGRLEKGPVASQHKYAFHVFRYLADIRIMVQTVPDSRRRRPDRTFLSFAL